MATDRIDLGNEKITKLFKMFVIPSILGMIAMTTAGLIDSYFIGNFVGAEGIEAITLVVPLFNMFSGVAAMIVSGGAVLAGISYGKKDRKRSNNLFNVTFFMLLIASFLLMLMVHFFGKSIVVDLMGVKGESITYVTQYLMTTNLFLPFFMLMFFFSFFLKLDGFPVTIVKVTLIGVVVNIIFDYAFVEVLSFGMRGAAVATGISQVIPSLIFIWITIKKSNWTFEWPTFHLSDMKEIIFNGSSEFLSLGSVGIAGYMYNLIIAKTLGSDGITAYGIAMQVASVAIMIFYGISDGIQSIISFNFGAGQLDRVDEIRQLAFKYSVIIGTLFAGMFIFSGEAISSIFVKDPSVQIVSSNILFFFGIATVLAGVNINTATYYTALGQPVKSGLLALTRSFLGFIIGLSVFPRLFPIYGLWIPIVFTEILTLGMVVYYMKAAPYGYKENQLLTEIK